MPSQPHQSPRRIIHGIATSPGLALGPVHVVHTSQDVVPTWSVAGEDVEGEIERLNTALEAAAQEMKRRQDLVSAQAGEKDAQIFAVHRMILQDPAALSEVVANIRDQRINAEAAVEMLIKRLERTLGELEGDSVRSYAADLSDPWHSVLQALMQSGRQQVLAGEERVVLAAAQLTPHVMTYLARERLLGVVAEAGGRFSHAAEGRGAAPATPGRTEVRLGVRCVPPL